MKRKKANVLITSVGSLSANHLINHLSEKNRIIAIDIYHDKYLALESEKIDKFIKVPEIIKEKEYLEKIIQIVENEKITFILPLTDLDVDFYSKHRSKFKNQCIAIPSKYALNYVRDKYNFYRKFENSIINLIPTFLKNNVKKEELIFPAIVKPSNGRSSIDTYLINKYEDLNYSLISDNHIVQPYYKGNVITIDVISDTKGKNHYCARLEVIRTKNGAGTTVKYIKNNSILTEIVEEVIKITKIHGIFNIELLKHKNRYYLMDINPRPSAGINFSYIFGSDMVNQLIDIYNEKGLVLKYKHSGVMIAKRIYHELY
jgi:carbamoyl-phosphate synthase large subunit